MRRVVLVSAGAEGEAARAWLDTLPDLSVSIAPGLDRLALDRTDLIWVHGAYSSGPSLEASLVPWLEAGGRLLATLDAATLASDLGLESTPPDEHREGVWHDAEDEFWLEEYRSFRAFPHVRGLAAFGPHPLFEGIDQGTYVWAPREGESFALRAYLARRPEAGRIVAVERSFIHLNPARAVAWEQAVGDGGILAIGAFAHLAAPDALLGRQLRAMLANAVRGDAIPHRDRAGRVTLWPDARPAGPTQASVRSAIPSMSAFSGEWEPSPSALTLTSPANADDPWTLAGRRVMLVGGERSGLQEAWSHPFRLLRDAAVFVAGEPPTVERVDIAPDEIRRTLTSASAMITERLTTALELPLLLWDLQGSTDVALSVEWTTDFRRMWPYPAGAFGALVFRLDEQRTRLWVGASSGTVQAVFSLSGGRFTTVEETGSPDARALRIRCEGEQSLRIAACAGTDDRDLEWALRSFERKGLAGVRRQRIDHAAGIARYGTALETPEGLLPSAFEWAKVRTDSFLAETPGIGRSLLAGYAVSRTGWADGRPGYAWYFGRDACWTAFGQLAAGEREAPRDVLKFLSRTQDITGKVMHEYTTSGLVHYDAADSTPLYLLLAARYAAWTGDIEYLGRLWPDLERAYRFCLETDRDGDGVIENFRVGHGWIEHGPLGGAHVTLYLAACWVAALEGLEPVAEALGHPAVAEEMREVARRARASVFARFRTGGDYALGLHADGSPQRHRTAMLSVPLLLGLVPPSEAEPWFDAVAAPGFSAPWGVRMIAADDPLFDPAGYHLGAVWPLYTGWVSLAEWRSGRQAAALSHLSANARLIGERAKGAFDEVLHGTDVGTPAGICPDQAWSAAMVLLPAIEGLWGVTPDALNAAVRVAPFLPPEWDRMAVRRLKVGRTTLDIEVQRRPGRLVIRIDRIHGPRIHLVLEPRGLPAVTAVTLDEQPLGASRAVFEVEGRHEAVFYF